jgi:hypothetical protein
MSTIAASAAASPAPAQATATSASGAATAQAPKKHFSVFKELLDIINPLQHLPIISTIYRRITGDEIDPVAKVAGGALYGGLIGLGLSVADVAVEKMTGEDTGDHVMDMLGIKSHDGKDKATAVADASGSSAASSGTTSAPAAPLPVIAPATSEADARTWFPAHAAGSVRTAALAVPSASAAKPASAATAAAATQTAPVKAAEASASAAKVATAAAASAAPVQPAAARPAAAQSAPASGSVPQMDQATFDALMRTLNNGKSIATVEANGADGQRKKDQAQAADFTPASPAAPARPSAAPAHGAKSYDDALKAMNAALDRYQAAGGHIPPMVTVPRFVPATPQAQ